MLSASGGPDPMTRGSALGPRWGFCSKTRVIDLYTSLRLKHKSKKSPDLGPSSCCSNVYSLIVIIHYSPGPKTNFGSELP